ncbi:TonB-dependent receptor domain-containing protein [Sandarakinorhabdus sp.]|uniref:TonB-dependent receptor n=1 Tax=Sandarakinorhabdus sp. TaxID=1916663 RepID=UPI00286EB05B|nr:TonB-dependent receptor [Sandarakinorhabdus sp.]
MTVSSGHQRFQAYLLGSAALMALGLAVPAAGQQAGPAQQAADDTAADEEILVTARRDTERLIDVPASVSVLTAETLARTGVFRAQEFLQLTPGVTIVSGTAEAGDTQINIRGLNGARDAESSVALVVDGILKTNTAQLNQVQGTLRQVEVLKGPQGALYGRNAAAGAIVMTTIKPGDVLSGAVRANYGELATGQIFGHVAGPISDTIGFVLSANYQTTDGFWRNEFLGNRKVVDDQQNFGLDGRIIAKLGPDTTLDVKARYAKLSGASINFNASFHLPNFAGVNPAFYENVNDRPFRYYSNIRPTNNQETWETSARIEHDFESMKLTAWALYSDVDQALTADGTSADFARYISNINNPTSQAVNNQCFATTAQLTGTPLAPPTFIGQIPVPFIFAPANGSTFGAYSPTTCDGTQLQTRAQSDFSAEMRLSSTGDGPISWSIGAYYLNIKRTTGISLGADLGRGVLPTLYNAPGSANPTSQLFNDRFNTSVYAGFGSLDWKPDEKFSAGLALRYDIEDRSATNLVPLVSDPITGGPINPGQAGGAIAPKSAVFRQLQPKVTVRYKLGEDTALFADWGVGFKSGGFNNQGSAAIVDNNFNDGVTPGTINAGVRIGDQYRKERSSAFEAGIKGSFLDGAVTYDAAAYYTQVRDMQFFEFFVGGFGLLRVVSNIDRVDLWGGEANVTVKPISGWSLFASGNVTDSKIKRNTSRPDTVGNKSPYTADYTLNLGTQVVLPITDGLRGTLRADYRLTGPTWFHSVQNQEKPTLFSGLLPISALALPAVVGNARYDVTRREAFGIVNLRAGLEGDNWQVTVFANNLLDRQWLNEVIPAIEFGGSFISPGQRRVIGVEAGFKF